MGIAKTRLVDELTIQQVIQGASKAWDDTEADTLKLVAKLLDANDRISFYLPASHDIKVKEKGKKHRIETIKTKVWVQGGVGAVTTRLRRMARDDLGWDALDVVVFVEAPHTDENTKNTVLRRDLWRAPFKGLRIPAKDINRIFVANDLPVPDWSAEGGRTKNREKRKPGEPKPATIAGWKNDYELIERLMTIHKCGPTRAARFAEISGGRKRSAFERGHSRYRARLREAEKRQNGKNPE